MSVDDRREQLRRAILDSAERAIAARGLAGLKARDLAQEAGCALGAIYTVFPDLDTIILATNLRTLALFERAIAERLGAAAPADATAAVETLADLGGLYLTFAIDHPQRWRALFQHRSASAAPAPDWYVSEQTRLFAYIEAPLAVLCPGLDGEARHLLARTLFSATHGIVSLGLDEKLLALPAPVLRAQVDLQVRAFARGLPGALAAA